MTTHLTRTDAGSAELAVELDADDLLRFVTRARERLSTELKIDGFRKGKVPSDLADKHLDQKQVRELALEFAVQETLSQAIEKEGLDVIQAHNLNITKNTADALAYSVALSLFPDVKLPDLATIRVARRPVAVRDADVDEALAVIQGSRSTFHAKDGPAASGDRAEVDFTVKKDDVVIEGGESANHPLIIGGKSFMPGFEDQLIGMAKGDVKDFILKAPDDYTQKSIAGAMLDFHVTLKNLQAVERPEVTDAFAQSLGDFKDVAHLKSNIRDGLLEEQRTKESQRVRLEALDAIASASAVAAAPAMVDEQLTAMTEDFERNLHERGMEPAMYLARAGKTWDDVRKEWRGEAERQVKQALIIRAVAKAKGLAVSEEDIDHALQEAAQSLTARGQASPEQINLEGLRRAIAERLMNEKALEAIEAACVA